MGLFATVMVIAGSLVIGLAYQVLGRAREHFDWVVGMVGAVYGGLFASAMLGPRERFGEGFEGLYIAPALAGGIVVGGVLLMAYRAFGSRSARHAASRPDVAVSRQVRLAYSAALFHEPIVNQMSRRFGVTTRIGDAEVHHGHGWVELEVSGVPAAVDAALASVIQSDVELEIRPEQPEPAAVAA
jgi:hypothetical protein